MSRSIVAALAASILVIETGDIIPQRLVCFLFYEQDIIGSVQLA